MAGYSRSSFFAYIWIKTMLRSTELAKNNTKPICIELGRCSVGIGEDFCRMFLQIQKREHSRKKPCSCNQYDRVFGIMTRRYSDYSIHTGERGLLQEVV